jgi:hypothetical protein
MAFYLQVYDSQDVIIGHANNQDLEKIIHMFMSLLTVKDNAVWVKVFVEGDETPYIYAFKNCVPMRTLLSSIPPNMLIH